MIVVKSVVKYVCRILACGRATPEIRVIAVAGTKLTIGTASVKLYAVWVAGSVAA